MFGNVTALVGWIYIGEIQVISPGVLLQARLDRWGAAPPLHPQGPGRGLNP